MIDCDTANFSVSQDDNDSGFHSDEDSMPDTSAPRTRRQPCLATQLPKCVPNRGKKENYPVKETQVWSPNSPANDAEVDDYLLEAENQYGFTAEQALALLYFNKYNIRESKNDLKCYAPLPHQWKEDKELFTEALAKVGKRFNKIRTTFFPNKSVADLVEYYYIWKMEQKKKRTRRISQQPTL